MENLLEIKNLCKNYKDFSLKNVSLTLPRGFIMGLIGKNGAGKTTMIRSILNMANIDSGEIKVFGLDSIKDSHTLKQRTGVVFDDIFFAHHLNIKQIESSLKGFYDDWDREEFFKLASKFGLPIHKKVGTFSRGMKMKLMVSMALSHKAELLILDEPTSGLDPVSRDELLDILAEYILNENKGIIFSTHITADLKRIADYITVLNNGEVWFSGTKDDLLEKFVIIKGEEEDLPGEVRKKSIGFHSCQSGFEALLSAEFLDILPDELEYEKADMDEIIIYISKEEMLKEV